MFNTEKSEAELKRTKSRHLPILDFYEILQLEWICAGLRRKIYPRIKDKNYWERVQVGKKETILKLAEKNSLPSIFDDETMLRTFEKKIYKESSYPNFVYKDENNKHEQEFYDLQNYYLQGSDVRVLIDGDIKLGKISKAFIPYKDFNVSVTIEGKEGQYSTSIVTRIL